MKWTFKIILALLGFLTIDQASFSQTITTFPHFEDLETWDTCNTNCGVACTPGSGWTNQGTAEFVTDTNGTPTGVTGPPIDHNPGTISGRYTYVESSGACNADTAILETPYVDLSSVVNPRVRFWYHQYDGAFGAPMGTDTFYVEITTDSGTTWNVVHTGPDQDTANEWLADSFSLASFVGMSVKLRWIWMTNNQFSDFGLDDFAFLGEQTLDAGIDSIYSSTGFCGNVPSNICFRLSNAGIIDIDTVTIFTTINGVPFNSPFAFDDTLTAGSDTLICLGTSSLTTGDTIRIYSSMPNNLADTFNTNDTAELIVTIFSPATAEAGPDTTICGLNAYTLGGSPTSNYATSYIWSPNNYVNDTTIANPIGYFTQSGSFIYTLFVEDSNGCFNYDTVSITVHPIPIIDAGPDTTVCIGDSVQIGGAPTTISPSTVLWSNGSQLSDSNAFNPMAFIPITQIFTLTVSDTFGCDYLDTVNIFSSSNPGLNAGDSMGVCIGDSVTLGGSPTASNFSSIVWTPSASLNFDTVPNPEAAPTVPTVYTIVLFDTNNCSHTDSVEVTPVALPSADAGPDTLLCAYDSFMVGGSPTGGINSIYNWSPSPLFSNPNAANPMALVLSDTLLIVEVTDTLTGCSRFDTAVITIHPLPVADAGFANLTICGADTITIGGNPTTGIGNTVLWTSNNTLSGAALFNPLLTASISDTILLTTTELVNNCSNFDTIFLVVDTLPQVEAGPNLSVCLDDSIALGGSQTGPSGVSFSWSYSGILSDSTLANPLGSPTQDTLFFVTVTDGNGCQSIDSQMVVADSLPVPVVDLVPDTSCLEDSTQLVATGGVSYAWGNSTFLSDDSISNPFAFFPATSIVGLTVTDANGCSDSTQITVPYWPLPVVGAGGDDTICDGNSAPLVATGAQNYVWSPGTGLSGTAIANPLASPNSTQTYVVEGTDVNGCKSTDTVTIFVNVLPQANAGSDEAICFGDSIQIGGSPTGPIGSSFSWNTTSVNFDTLANPQYYGNTVGTFTIEVTVTDQNMCSSSDDMDLTVNVLPVPMINIQDTTICDGDSLLVWASGGLSYQWFPSSSLESPTSDSSYAFPGDTTLYTVTVTDVNGCEASISDTLDVYPPNAADAGPDTFLCQQDSIILTATGGVIYQWNSSVFLLNGSTANPQVFPLVTETFTVTVTDANTCENSDQTTVVVKPLPNISAGADKRMCIGQTVKIGGSPTGPSSATYTWIPSVGLTDSTIRNPKSSPDQTTIYKVIGTTTFGCQDSAEMEVVVDTLPIVKILDSPSPICLGDTTSARVTNGFMSYSWAPIEGILGQDSNRVSFSPTKNRRYILTVINDFGCQNVDTVNITVWQLPKAVAGDDKEMCAEDSVTLFASGGVLYDWDNGALLSNASSNVGSTKAYPLVTTDFTVTVTDSNGCKSSDMANVRVFQLPEANAGEDIENCDVDVVYLGSTLVIDPTLSYRWTPEGGLSDPYGPNPYVIEPENRVYTLEVQDMNGCFNYDSVLVEGDCYPIIYAPNAFTPGQDNNNDVFIIHTIGIIETKLVIYDRWGQSVFETDDLNEGWGGEVGGNLGLAPAGAYHWLLSYRVEGAKKTTKRGSINLLR